MTPMIDQSIVDEAKELAKALDDFAMNCSKASVHERTYRRASQVMRLLIRDAPIVAADMRLAMASNCASASRTRPTSRSIAIRHISRRARSTSIGSGRLGSS